MRMVAIVEVELNETTVFENQLAIFKFNEGFRELGRSGDKVAMLDGLKAESFKK